MSFVSNFVLLISDFHTMCYSVGMTIDTNAFKKKLLEEKKLVEQELSTVARRNPKNPKDWEPVPSDRNGAPPDRDEATEKIESFEENTAIVRQLESRLGEVTAALERITNGSYGNCPACGKEIETARLEANSAAATCTAHMK